jgi:tetratricopeptide (TPR) repeat protein
MPENKNILTKFWQELKRRRTARVIVSYAATAFIVLQLADILTPALLFPAWTTRLVTIILIIGFPVAVIISWIFDITPGGIKKTESLEELAGKEIVIKPDKRRLRISNFIIAVLMIIVVILAYPKIFKRDTLERLRSSGERIAVAVMPFQNMTNDTTWNVWQLGIQHRLISFFSNTPEIKVRQKEVINTLIQNEGLAQYAALSPSIAGKISEKLDADIFIYGSLLKAGTEIQLDAQLIDTKTKEVLKSIEVNGPYKEEEIIGISDTLRKRITDFLLISKLIKENPLYGNYPISTNSPEAFRYFIYGKNAEDKGDFATAEYWLLKSIAIDSNYFDARIELPAELGNQGKQEQNLHWILKNYKEKDQWPINQQLYVNSAYSWNFEPPEEQIKRLKQIQEVDDQATTTPYVLGVTYMRIKQHDKAIPEFKKSIEISRKMFGWKKYSDDLVWVNANLGWSYIKTGKYKEAKILYRKVERNCKDQKSNVYSWIIDGQAWLALALKDSVTANRYIDKFISVLKENSTSLATISQKVGEIYFEAGLVDKGEELYRKALLLEPANPSRLNALAWVLIDHDRKLDEALKLVDKALESCPDRSSCFMWMDTKGWGLYKQGKYKEALELFEKIWEQRPYYSSNIYSHFEEVRKAVAGQK